MPYGSSASRVLVAALAAGAIAAPAATAKPIHPLGSVAPPAHTIQDLRGEAAIEPTAADLRSDGGGGADAPIVGLVIAGTIVLGGGLAVTAVRRGPRVAH